MTEEELLRSLGLGPEEGAVASLDCRDSWPVQCLAVIGAPTEGLALPQAWSLGHALRCLGALPAGATSLGILPTAAARAAEAMGARLLGTTDGDGPWSVTLAEGVGAAPARLALDWPQARVSDDAAAGQQKCYLDALGAAPRSLFGDDAERMSVFGLLETASVGLAEPAELFWRDPTPHLAEEAQEMAEACAPLAALDGAAPGLRRDFELLRLCLDVWAAVTDGGGLGLPHAWPPPPDAEREAALDRWRARARAIGAERAVAACLEAVGAGVPRAEALEAVRAA